MDEADREEKRDVPNISENKKKDRFNAFFKELRAMLQTHGYPVKGDRSKTAQDTTTPSQKKEGKVNPETSREQSDWIPSFHSYEDFKCKTLQSLDGFMIILSTDGVIIFVPGNITCLLGHLPNDIVGKKLLSLLPDHERNEVFGKIALKLPLSNSVGKHIDFCCHLKRGNVEYDNRPTYEYVKFILTVKDISSEPLVLFSSFFPSHSYAESSPTYLPLEDRFYLVGSICLLRAQTLREVFTVKKPGEEVLLIQDSDDEERVSPERRSQDQKKFSRMELLHPESADAASDDQADILTVEPYGPQESVHVNGIESDIYYDSSTSSLESSPASPATSSSQSFDFKPDVEQVYDVDEVQQMDEMEEVDQMGEMGKVEQRDEEDEVEQVEQVEEVEEEARSPSNAAAGISDEPQLPPLITSYIRKRELELMKKFKEQLEEKTQIMQANIRSQQDALEMMKEQLQRMQDSSFQMQPRVSHHLDRPESQSLEPVPKKQRTEQMKEINLSSGSCSSHSFKFSEEFEEPCDVSSQPLLQGEDPFLPQALLQVQDQHVGQPLLRELQTRKWPQPPNAAAGSQALPIRLLGRATVAVPLCEDPGTFMQTQSIAVPVQLVAGQHASGYYQDETLGDNKDDRPSLVTVDTPQDYIQLLKQPRDPQYHLYLQVNTWPSSEQNTLQGQAAQPQAPASEASLEASQDPDEYSPGHVSYFMSAEPSSLDEHQRWRHFHTRP
ncbi:circadian clock protein PASD1 [Zalophus californianus]|uniref:Circadian clock protein PASD1 n=1 Tax=Zalophus californianus TaxID=9704 RepID=A0A6J2EBD3_ZALCA|nr:circadian clock protein PASD1 [Zalophus californianus]XP_027464212.1 circadian clock protein PASD1 [Zalophus californianus]